MRRRRGRKNPPHFAELYAVSRMIAQLPFHIGEEGGNARLCTVVFRMTQFSFFAEETEREHSPAELGFWVIFLARFFSAPASSPSRGWSLICTSAMKRSWAWEAKQAKAEQPLMGFRTRRALPQELMVTKGGTRRWAGCAAICL